MLDPSLAQQQNIITRETPTQHPTQMTSSQDEKLIINNAFTMH
jgi:hypothetical protein